MRNKYLNAREWLEAERLTGNEWAQELLELLDGQDQAEANAEALEDIAKALPDPVAACALLTEGEHWRFVEQVRDCLHLLAEIEDLFK
jgi:hypothetical protein